MSGVNCKDNTAVSKQSSLDKYFQTACTETNELSSDTNSTFSTRSKNNTGIKSSKSPYWKHFQKKNSVINEKESAICRLCDQIVSLGGVARTANTTNMKRHLKNVHPKEYADTGKFVYIE